MYSQEEQFFKKVHWNLIHSITLLIIQIKALTITDEGFISWWASCESNTAPTDSGLCGFHHSLDFVFTMACALGGCRQVSTRS